LHKVRERRIDVAFAAGVETDDLQSEDAGRRLHFLQLVRHARIARIDEITHRPRLGNQVAQQFEPFRSQCGDGKVHAGHIAARPVEAGNEAEFDRVGAGRENDRNGRGRSFRGDCRRAAAGRKDHCHLTTNQIGRQRR